MENAVQVSLQLLTDVLESFKKAGPTTCWLNPQAVQALAIKVAEACNVPSRMVIYDHAQVFIDGRRVDGFTPLQVAILEYLVDAGGSASVDSLIDHVWRKPDTNFNAVYVTMHNLNNRLEPFRCYVEKQKGGLYELKFNS